MSNPMVYSRFVVAGMPVKMSSEIFGKNEGNELSVDSRPGPIVADCFPEVSAKKFNKSFLNFGLVEQVGNFLANLTNREELWQFVLRQGGVKLSIDISFLRHGHQVADHANEAPHVSGNLCVNVRFQFLQKRIEDIWYEF